MRENLRNVVLVAAWLHFGCASDDDPVWPREGSIAPRPLPGCESESYAPCDVQSEACQMAVFSSMSCLRGSSTVEPPPSRTLTVTEYRAELVAGMANEDAALTQAYEDCLVLFNLARAGDLSAQSRVDLSTSTIPAYYSWQTKQVTFVEPDAEPAPAVRESAYVLLAHEYVHALQDVEHDLGQLMRDRAKTTDASLAVRSLVEGEAVTHEYAFLAASWGLDPEILDWDARYAALEAFHAKSLVNYPPILAIWRSVPYEAGGRYVLGLLQSGGMPAIRAAFDAPPQAMSSVAAGVEPIPVEQDAPAPAEGYEVFEVDSFGSELLRDSLSQVTAMSLAVIDTIAADWRGDRVYFYRNPTTGYVALLWRLRLATAASKNALLGASGWKTLEVDGDVMLAQSTDPNRASVIATLFENANTGVTVASSGTTDGSTQAGRLRRLLEPLGPNWPGTAGLR